MLADYYIGNFISFLTIHDITVGSVILLIAAVFLLCTAIIGWYALSGNDTQLMFVVSAG